MDVLWHLAISHYSEKVRWALDYKRVPHVRRAQLPGLHMAVALGLTRGRAATLPVMRIGGRTVGDSTAILAALEERHPDPPLYPADPGDRARAIALEDRFDRLAGPAARQFVFVATRNDPEAFTAAGRIAAPAVFDRFGPLAREYARALVRVRYDARDAVAADARARVVAAFDALDAELGDREHLVGDAFSVADLTAAALLYLIVLPPQGPLRLDRLPEPVEQLRAELRDRPGYRWVQRTYERYR
jgi:glutathione S-transferase